MSGILRDQRLEDKSIANFFNTPDGAFLFKPANNSLHGRIGRAFLFWKGFLYLAHGSGSELPELLHDFQLEFGQFYALVFGHEILLNLPRPTSEGEFTTFVGGPSRKIFE